jgi:hypothetical protein
MNAVEEDHTMGNRFRFRWLFGLALFGVLAAVGMFTYNLGIAHGIAESGRFAVASGTGTPVVFWPRPWGVGFFPFFPLLFVLFWFAALRGLFWRGAWGGRGCGHGDRGVPPAFDEWHRRAHAQPAPPASETKA